MAEEGHNETDTLERSLDERGAALFLPFLVSFLFRTVLLLFYSRLLCDEGIVFSSVFAV